MARARGPRTGGRSLIPIELQERSTVVKSHIELAWEARVRKPLFVGTRQHRHSDDPPTLCQNGSFDGATWSPRADADYDSMNATDILHTVVRPGRPSVFSPG
jgi:hypothetical protein